MLTVVIDVILVDVIDVMLTDDIDVILVDVIEVNLPVDAIGVIISGVILCRAY